MTHNDDTLLQRSREAVQPPEGSDASVLPSVTQNQINKIVTAYYLEQDWDSETGVPTVATLAELVIDGKLVNSSR